MNLKNERFDYWALDDGIYGVRVNTDYHPRGDYISCDTLVYFIKHQKQQFGMNAEKILGLLVEELS